MQVAFVSNKRKELGGEVKKGDSDSLIRRKCVWKLIETIMIAFSKFEGVDDVRRGDAFELLFNAGDAMEQGIIR